MSKIIQIKWVDAEYNHRAKVCQIIEGIGLNLESLSTKDLTTFLNLYLNGVADANGEKVRQFNYHDLNEWLLKNQDTTRKQLWMDIAVACSSSDNIARAKIAVSWADEILREFDARFKDD